LTVAVELLLPAVIPGPVQVYVTGVAVVLKTIVVEVTWQFKLLLADAVTDGSPALCRIVVLAIVLGQLLRVEVTTKL